MENNKTHGQILEPRMRELNEKFRTAGFDEELFKIIHFPGYTTPAEFLLIHQNLEMLHQMTDLVKLQMQNILVGSRKILEGSREYA